MLRLEGLVRDGTVKGHEVFMFTDNSVFESSYYRGHSTSKKLLDITFWLHRAVRMGVGGFKLHVIHVAGTRMKHWGVDGLSRGNTLEGLMAGRKGPAVVYPLI